MLRLLAQSDDLPNFETVNRDSPTHIPRSVRVYGVFPQHLRRHRCLLAGLVSNALHVRRHKG